MSKQPEVQRSLRVVGISGSLRPTSKTYWVLRQSLGALSAQGAQSHLLDLAAEPLPLFSGYVYPDAEQKALSHFRTTVGASDIVLLASPEYHGAVSGSLKNALDHLSEESFRGKIVGLIGVAGGSVSPVATTLQLRSIVRSLGGVASPCELLVSQVKKVLDEQGKIIEPKLLSRVTHFATELMHLAKQLTPTSSISALVNA